MTGRPVSLSRGHRQLDIARFSLSLRRLTSETNPLGIATRCSYDAAGNRATKLDGNGNTTTYGDDANRRLKTVTFADGTGYAYDYDARGNRILEWA